MRDHDSDCYCGRCREDRADNPTGQSKTPRTDEWEKGLQPSLVAAVKLAIKHPTPRSDAAIKKCNFQQSGADLVVGEFSRVLERELAECRTELTAALAERDEARETLDLMCDEFQRIKALAGLPLEAHTFCERAISGIKQRVPLVEQRDKAEKERDEARRLLGEARRVMQQIYDDTEGYADGAPDASAHDRLCNEISGKLRQPLNQITNHLK